MSSTTVARPRRSRRVLVYSPSHRRDVVQAFGAFYTFEPHGVGKCGCAEHNVNGMEDNEGCHAVLDYPRDEKNKLLIHSPRKVGADGELTAERVADFIVSDACRGGSHFVILEGTQEEIAELKRVADAAYVSQYLEKAEAAIASWENYVSRFRTENPGLESPRMPKDVQEDYAFRRRHREAMKVRAAHVCKACSYETDVRRDYTDHVIEEHPNSTEAAEIRNAETAPPAAVRVEASLPPGATPPKDEKRIPAGDGKKLLARAETVGIELTVADRKGLVNDDFDVYEDVQARIEEGKEAAKKRRDALKEQAKAQTAARKAEGGAAA